MPTKTATPKTSSSRKAAKAAASVQQAPSPAKPSPASGARSPRKRKRAVAKESAADAPAEPEVASAVPPVDIAATAEVSAADEPVQKPVERAPPFTVDTMLETFSALILANEAELKRMQASKSKKTGAKYLRTQNKHLKQLRTNTFRLTKRLSKQKGRKKTGSANSGFLKPVTISPELLKFTGWDAQEPHSRVDVTRYICKYIKDNNLQNPDNRRQIHPDAKLQKLLAYDPKTQTEPLTYASLQTYLKTCGHFPQV